MYQIDFNKPQNVHFIGIGGISMSGLAEILLGRGFHITGSDSQDSALLTRLRNKGAEIFIGQSADNIKNDCEVVVYTAAIHPDNPEFVAAKEAGIPMLSRADLLGEIMQNYRVSIAVAGTHGKTTTTSMASHVLLAADMDPTISVGGILQSIHGNIRVGESGTFLTEACEYTNSFLSLYPMIGIILNVDADHLDFFKDLDDIANSFHRFAAQIPADGTLIIDRDTKKFDTVTEGLGCEIITKGSVDGSTPGISVKDVTIYAGSVTATGFGGAGIGSAKDVDYDGTVTIYGGDVTAVSENDSNGAQGSGIGAGADGNDSSTLIIGAGIGMIDDNGRAIANPKDELQTVTKRKSTMKIGVEALPKSVSYMEKGITSLMTTSPR